MKTKFKLFHFLFIVLLGLNTFNTFGQNDSSKSLRVYFKFNSSSIDPDYAQLIDSVFSNQENKINSIEAYCDSIGNLIYNDSLSIKRAHAVKNYLFIKNMCDSSVAVKTFGKRILFNSNSTEAERSLNRCVIINFISFDKTDTVDSGFKIKSKTGLNKLFLESNREDSVIIKNKLSLENNLAKTDVGSSIVLNNLNFIPGRHELMNSSKTTLKELYELLILYPTLVIEIQGYICCLDFGDGIDLDTGTLNLSVNRARTVYDYLIAKGISKSRLSYRGFGSRNKISSEMTEEGKQRNRRVEIKIIKK